MMAFLMPLLTRYGLTVAKWGALALLVVTAFISVKNMGRAAERVESLERTIDAVRVRNKVESEAAGLSDDELDDGLRPPNRRGR